MCKDIELYVFDAFLENIIKKVAEKWQKCYFGASKKL